MIHKRAAQYYANAFYPFIEDCFAQAMEVLGNTSEVLKDYSELEAFFLHPFFSKEEKDGIIYQEVPQPSALHGDPAPGTEGQYVGEVIPSSGYLRIKVTPQNVGVEYVRIAPTESAGIAYSYNVE